MNELGFWRIAAAHPTHLALVDSDGREIRAGELLARANRLVHGLRRLGLAQGATVATVLPNEAAMIEAYLAVAQAGWYLVPINHHLTAPEIAYILRDSGAEALIASDRFGAAARAAAEEAEIPQPARLAIGAIPSFRSLADFSAAEARSLPGDRCAGQVMNYTSGTTGRPKGVRRKLMPFDPDDVASTYAMFLAMFGIQPGGDGVHLTGSPLYHTAVLVFTACSLHFWHTVVLMDKWTPE